MAKVGLVWFDQDFRIDDNPSLIKAAIECDQLICVACFDPQNLLPNRYGLTGFSENRLRFFKQSIQELEQNLRNYGQQLLIAHEQPLSLLIDLVNRYQVCTVYRQRSFGYYENGVWQDLQQRVSQLVVEVSDAHTLFDSQQLTDVLNHFPKHFTQFRHQVEGLRVNVPLSPPDKLPGPPLLDWGYAFNNKLLLADDNNRDIQTAFVGGETQARLHLNSYFSGSLPKQYKSVRDQLDGWDNSTKFSPWLSNGCLSVRQIYSALKAYQTRNGRDESSDWIFFELLWREFFQWNAYIHSAKLFRFRGLKSRPPLTSFYAERFQKWCKGNTPYPLVNASMNQLSRTGYISNRARQIVASCLVNELDLDWRFGAAYFEQQLLDYDVAVNWGNWQYLAGVGADPRGQRHFNLEKQAQLFDPEGDYVKQWQGQKTLSCLDSVDAADWPLYLPD